MSDNSKDSIVGVVVKNDISDNFLPLEVFVAPIDLTDNQLGYYISEFDGDYQRFPDHHIYDIKKFRPEYDYASIKLSSYKDKEDDINKLPVVYELIVEANGNYYTLDKVESQNGDADFKHLALGQKYYIRASDLSGEYKSQMVEFIPTEKDQDMQIQILTTYNLASNSGFSYYFILKNVIDENPYVYIQDQPKLNLVKNTNGTYTITGTPSNRIITLNVEHEKGLLVQQDQIELTIDGSIDPIQTQHYTVYEAPYRVLKSIDADIDNKLTEDVNYSKVIIQAEYVSPMNSGGYLYIQDDNSYRKDIHFIHTSTFNLNQDIKSDENEFKIKSIVGSINTNDVVVIGDERLLIVSYNMTTNIITVIRGIDGTIPVNHLSNTKCYIEYMGNVSNENFDKNTYGFNYSTTTFSTETELNSEKKKNINIYGIAAKPYPPLNLKIDNSYKRTVRSGIASFSWSTTDNKENIIGYYECDDVSDILSTIITIYDIDDNIVFTDELAGGVNSINVDFSDIDSYRLRFILNTKSNGLISINNESILFNVDKLSPPTNIKISNSNYNEIVAYHPVYNLR